MDWDAKWTWENLVLFNPKTVENPKNQTTSWQIEDGITRKGHLRHFDSEGSSSGSELAPGSLTRSSISVCTDSSFKDVMENTQVAVGKANAFSGDFREKEELDKSSVRSGESTIWLKLGKGVYFENNSIASNAKTVSLDGVSRSSILKKTKLSNVNGISCCQVEGCNVDLTSAKEYHRKQKVCASHSKCPKVVIKGLERRFCQQCSRFHSLSEFDKNKRSCRKRLSEHNTRRRKPQFNTMRLPSPFSAYASTEGRRQISFTSNNIPHIHHSDSTWQNAFSSKFTTDKRGGMLKFGKTEGIDEHLQMAETGLPLALNLPGHISNRLLPSTGTESQTLSLGFKKPVQPPNSDSGPDFHHAFSLLSNHSWGYPQPSNNSLDHTDNINHIYQQPLMQDFPHIFPRNSSEFSQIDHHITDNLHNRHSQFFKEPYEDVFHSNLFN